MSARLAMHHSQADSGPCTSDAALVRDTRRNEESPSEDRVITP
ncbi:MAG: hypothetical protein QXP97_01510 [Desulfurococcus sp.]